MVLNTIGSDRQMHNVVSEHFNVTCVFVSVGREFDIVLEVFRLVCFEVVGGKLFHLL